MIFLNLEVCLRFLSELIAKLEKRKNYMTITGTHINSRVHNGSNNKTSNKPSIRNMGDVTCQIYALDSAGF